MTDTEDALKAFDRCKGTLLNGSVQAYLIPLQYVETIRSALQSQGWQEISSAPREPVNNYQGPHFIGLTTDYGAIECWYGYPQPGSIAYAENHPPKIEFICPCMGFVSINPTHWQPLPPPPKVMK